MTQHSIIKHIHCLFVLGVICLLIHIKQYFTCINHINIMPTIDIIIIHDLSLIIYHHVGILLHILIVFFIISLFPCFKHSKRHNTMTISENRAFYTIYPPCFRKTFHFRISHSQIHFFLCNGSISHKYHQQNQYKYLV